MRGRFLFLAGAAGLLVASVGTQAALARDLNEVVGTLNAILNPGDAQRYEEQARRNRQYEEERYWRDYRYGLEHRGGREYERGGYGSSYDLDQNRGEPSGYGRDGYHDQRQAVPGYDPGRYYEQQQRGGYQGYYGR